MDVTEQLLTDWDNRPLRFWAEDAGKQLPREIALLETLKEAGSRRVNQNA